MRWPEAHVHTWNDFMALRGGSIIVKYNRVTCRGISKQRRPHVSQNVSKLQGERGSSASENLLYALLKLFERSKLVIRN